MEFKVNGNEAVDTGAPASKVGLEDVTRSARALLRTTRGLGTASLEVVERELAMAISLSEQIRDGLVKPQALERTRKPEIAVKFREDAHRTVDLAIDAGTLAVNSALDFLERFADTRRQALPIDAAAVKKPVSK